MVSAIQRQEDGTVRLTVTVPSEAVKKMWDEIVDEAVKNTEMPGFRKGKAPKQFVEEKILNA